LIGNSHSVRICFVEWLSLSTGAIIAENNK